MEAKNKNEIIESIIDCIGEAIDLDSDDNEKDDILNGLLNLCKDATYLSTKKTKRQWIKSWRSSRSERGSFSFLTRELLLSDDASYRNYIRMSKTQFDHVLNFVQEDIRRSKTHMRNAISPAEKLSLTLRFLATGETFQSLGYQTRVSKSNISGIVPEACEAIYYRKKGTYLKFPSNQLEWEAVAREFAIKHISFRSRRKDGAFYHNYKGTNSIILMVLVDANCKFIFVDIGCNGRSNDAGVFSQSKLKTILEEIEIPKNSIVGNVRSLPYVVVGDDAFPLQTHVMKPYPYHTNSREKQIFNARLSRGRHVKHAFGILANRFRVFLAPMNLKVETVESITFACCILHNYLLTTEDTYINSIADTPAEISDNLSSVYNPRKGGAELLRQQFMEYLTTKAKWIGCDILNYYIYNTVE